MTQQRRSPVLFQTPVVTPFLQNHSLRLSLPTAYSSHYLDHFIRLPRSHLSTSSSPSSTVLASMRPHPLALLPSLLALLTVTHTQPTDNFLTTMPTCWQTCFQSQFPNCPNPNTTDTATLCTCIHTTPSTAPKRIPFTNNHRRLWNSPSPALRVLFPHRLRHRQLQRPRGSRGAHSPFRFLGDGM